jgi:hypothetical protein
MAASTTCIQASLTIRPLGPMTVACSPAATFPDDPADAVLPGVGTRSRPRRAASASHASHQRPTA